MEHLTLPWIDSLRTDFDEGDMRDHSLHYLWCDHHEGVADDAKNSAGHEDGSEALD